MIDLPVPVVLASTSSARRQLLSTLISTFSVLDAGVDESMAAGGDPSEVALRLAEQKARAVAGRRPGALVIGADTVAVCGGRVLGKPADRLDAERMLWELTRQPHSVLTGVFVSAPDGRCRAACVETRLRMRRMSRAEISGYAAHPDVVHWAGAYALQPNDPNVESIEGSRASVMGLPVEELAAMLADLYPECAER